MVLLRALWAVLTAPWVLVMLLALAVAAYLGVSEVQTWNDQNEQRAEAQRQAEDFQAKIAELEAEIERRSSDEAVQQAALCFGPYVEPGTEVYAVAGLRGCVAAQPGSGG